MNNIIAIVGPTGVGKTKMSIEIAKTMGGEIISCDSMQFYRGLDIGTAKVTKSEMQGIKHHLIDIIDPSEEFSVAEYQNIVRNKISELLRKNITPILVGGSGLFISSIVYDYKFNGAKRDDSIFEKYESFDLGSLVAMLTEKSPKVAEKTDLGNRRRVLRALEKDDSDLDLSGKNLFYENSIIIGLALERGVLYKKINSRVDTMIEAGLLKEAEWLYKQDLDSQATKAIGYKEFFSYFKEENDLAESISILKRNSRRFAKRQMTWFKNKMNCHWLQVDIDNFDETINQAINLIKEKKTD
jgi:tRNA dimethylallyltransferase